MNRHELEQAIERAKAFREEIENVRQLYEQPQPSLEGVEDLEEVGRLLPELVGTMQSISLELNQLFPAREILMNGERIRICSPIPAYLNKYPLQGYKIMEDGLVVLSGDTLSPFIKELIREYGWIPPWDRWPPIP